MALYFSIAFVILLLVFLGKPQVYAIWENERKALVPIEQNWLEHKIVQLLSALILVAMFVLTGFRSIRIGNDTANYSLMFEMIADGGITRALGVEMGYQIFCLVISKFTKDPHVFFVICAAISYLAIGVYIFKKSYDIPASLCLFFSLSFSFFMSGMRQSLAMVLTLYAYDAIKNKENWKALILILTASTFHTTALACLLWLGYEYFPRKLTTVCFITAALAIASASGLLNGILRHLFLRYSDYFEGSHVGTGWLGVAVAMLQGAMVYYVIYCSCGLSVWEKQSKLASANALLTVLYACLGFSINLFTRASNYFLLIACVDLPNAVCYQQDRRTIIRTVCVLFIIYFFVVLVFRPDWNHIYPYEFWS